MAFEAIVADIAFEPPIITFLKGDQVVMDLGCQVDLAVQMTQPLRAIELKDQSTPRHLYAFLGFDIALDRFQRNRANTRPQPRLAAAARHERRLEGVGCRPMLDLVWGEGWSRPTSLTTLGLPPRFRHLLEQGCRAATTRTRFASNGHAGAE